MSCARPNQMRVELRRLLETAPSEETSEGAIYRVYYCTVYYTPRESGFTAERGFDDTRVSAAGLQGRKYPLAFLQAVKREGFGRLSEPVDGLDYLQYLAAAVTGLPRRRWATAATCSFRGTPAPSRKTIRFFVAVRFCVSIRQRFKRSPDAANGSLTTQAEAFTRSRLTCTGAKTIPSVRSVACARVRQGLAWSMLSM